MESYDVVVVGAGPSGLNTALDLAKSGIKVLVLEKNRIGETNKTWLSWVGIIKKENLEDHILHKFNTLSFLSSKNKLETKSDWCSVDEPKILKTIAERVESEGAIIKDKTKFTSYTRTRVGLKVNTTSKSFKTKLLVDASGFDQNMNQNSRRMNIYAKIYKNVALENPDEGIIMDTRPRKEFAWDLTPMGENKVMVMTFTTSQFPLNINHSKKYLEYYTKKYPPLAKQFKNAKEIDTRFGSIPILLKNPLCLDNVIKVGDSTGGQHHLHTGMGFNNSFKFSKVVNKLIIESLENEIYDGNKLMKRYYALMNSEIPMFYYHCVLVMNVVEFFQKTYIDSGLIKSELGYSKSLRDFRTSMAIEILKKSSNSSRADVVKGESTSAKDFVFPLIRSFPTILYELLRMVVLQENWEPR